MAGKFDKFLDDYRESDLSTLGGVDTNIQFNDNGSLGGDSDFTWNKTNNELNINGNVIIDGDADEKQLKIVGSSGQTSNIFTVENSINDPLLVVTYDGNVGIGTSGPDGIFHVNEPATYVTSYSNPGGTGNRTSIITATGTISFVAGGPTNLINGGAGGDCYFLYSTPTGTYLKYDFGTARFIDEAIWTQQTPDSHGTWKWSGSNDDVSYTDIGSSFTWGGSTSQVQTELSNNTQAWRYYKATFLSGGLSGGPYLYEINFKIDDGSVATETDFVVKSQGKVGINQLNPTERLDIQDNSGNGAIRIGDTDNTNEGTIRYNGTNFQGYNGSSWIDLDTTAPVWGDITGTLSDQTDLQAELDYLTVKPNTYAGASTLPTITYNSGDSGEITITSFTAFVHKTAGWDDELEEYTFTGITPTLTANTYSYLVANYNSGTPDAQITTNPAIINSSNIVLISHLYWEYQTSPVAVDELHYFIPPINAYGKANKLTNRLINTNRYERSSGLELGETGTMNITLTGGVVWYGDSSVVLSALNTSTGSKIHFYYHLSGNWVVDNTVTTYNNSQYDNGTDLVTLGNNKYSVNWIYRSMDGGQFLMVLGAGNYSLLEAQDSQPPSLPTIISRQSILVGRIIVKKTETTATEIDSAFEYTFSPSGVIEHNDLTNIQGGTSGEYYHLTQAEYNTLSGKNTATITTNSDTIPKVTNVLVNSTNYSFSRDAYGKWSIINDGTNTWTITRDKNGGKVVSLA